jgi:hypothetical protein
MRCYSLAGTIPNGPSLDDPVMQTQWAVQGCCCMPGSPRERYRATDMLIGAPSTRETKKTSTSPHPFVQIGGLRTT